MGPCTADLMQGQVALTIVRRVTTLISITITSAWFRRTKVKRLSLFFAHWLAGLVAGLGQLVEDAMISVCWTGSNLEGFIKALKFMELSSFNMFAVTNLAINVNLALVVSSHRTMSFVQSVSSPQLLLVFLVVAAGFAAPIIPLGEIIRVSAVGFYVVNSGVKANVFIQIFFFYVEFFVGICMLLTVSWLLMFRLREIKECWKLHARIRFYFVLTLIGTAINLSIGICGLINVLSKDYKALLIIWSWIFRYIHIALDTIILYGVLRDRRIDERRQVDSGKKDGSG
eukprot:g11677.t1